MPVQTLSVSITATVQTIESDGTRHEHDVKIQLDNPADHMTGSFIATLLELGLPEIADRNPARVYRDDDLR